MSSKWYYFDWAELRNEMVSNYGFQYNLMVVGDSGLGKSTLINTMFKNWAHQNKEIASVHQVVESTLKIETQVFTAEMCGDKIKTTVTTTVVDTPGFGHFLNPKDCWKPVVDYIDEQFDKYYNELGLNGRQISDSRVHCCLYLISPKCYRLKQLDISAMKALHKKVSVVPIIAKSDFLTKEETRALKKRILNDLKANEIQIYSIPDSDSEDEEESEEEYDEEEYEEYKECMCQLKAAVPFAVNSSVESPEVKVKNRLYPWGIVVETENPKHSDFEMLRAMLVTHLPHMRHLTRSVHYENYRLETLGQHMD